MFVEFRIQTTMKFLQQILKVGEVSKTISITSSQLKNTMKRKFEQQKGTMNGIELPIFNLIDSKYVVSYSPIRDVNLLIKEKDMIITSEYIIRHRPPIYNDVPHRRPVFNIAAQTRTCLQLIYDIVTEFGGHLYGDVQIYSYMPLNPDGVEYATLIRNNASPIMREFFTGGDIPSTVFACTCSYTFHTMSEQQFKVPSIQRLTNGLRIQSSGQVHNPAKRGHLFARIALGLYPHSNDITYLSFQDMDEGDEGIEVRIIDGPETEGICEALRRRAAASPPSVEEDEDEDMFEEDEDEYDEDNHDD